MKVYTKEWLLKKYGITKGYFECRKVRETKKAIIIRMNEVDGYLPLNKMIAIAKSLIINIKE